MSYDIQLDTTTHDLVIVAGDAQVINEARRVAQQIKITLLFFLGEWFLDTSFGVPYLEDILVKNPRWSRVQTVLRARIADVPGVRRVVTLKTTLDAATRGLRVEFEADTLFGLTGPHNVALTLQGT